MITIAQAKNTHDVVENFKPDVVVGWVNTGARWLDGFTRDIMSTYHTFEQATSQLKNKSGNEFRVRVEEGHMGFAKTDRVYITAVIARHTIMGNTLQYPFLERTLTQIANAMRADGLTTIVLPNISSSRTQGLRTRDYLDIIDRVMYDMNVYVATAVPLTSHDRGYVDLTTRHVPQPVQVKKKLPLGKINSGYVNPYSGCYAG